MEVTRVFEVVPDQSDARISVRLPPDSTIAHLVTVTSGAAGTQLFPDGQLAGQNPRVVLRMPSAPSNARLVLGNAADGTHRGVGAFAASASHSGHPAPTSSGNASCCGRTLVGSHSRITERRNCSTRSTKKTAERSCATSLPIAFLTGTSSPKSSCSDFHRTGSHSIAVFSVIL